MGLLYQCSNAQSRNITRSHQLPATRPSSVGRLPSPPIRVPLFFLPQISRNKSLINPRESSPFPCLPSYPRRRDPYFFRFTSYLFPDSICLCLDEEGRFRRRPSRSISMAAAPQLRRFSRRRKIRRRRRLERRR